jgi:hypothetical protein
MEHAGIYYAAVVQASQFARLLPWFIQQLSPCMQHSACSALHLFAQDRTWQMYVCRRFLFCVRHNEEQLQCLEDDGSCLLPGGYVSCAA